MLTIPGRCRICGCTELAPCHWTEIIRDEETPMVCAWLDFDRTICTNPRCVAVVPLTELERLVFVRDGGLAKCATNASS